MKHGKCHSTEATVAGAGFGSRSGNRFDRDPTPPSRKMGATGRACPDPLGGMFDEEVVPIPDKDSGIRAFGAFKEPMRRHPESDPGVRRALKRRIRGWRVRRGPDREVIFRRTHTLVGSAFRTSPT